MPTHRRQAGRWPIVGMAGVVAALTTLVASTTVASYADDDYPYSGLGQCPLVPLPPQPATTPPGPPAPAGQPGAAPTAAPTAGATQAPPPQLTSGSTPGTAHQAPPQQPEDTGVPTAPATGPVDAPSAPPVPRECARNIWFIDGSYGDPWGFALRNCTSFVGWRLREVNGVDFTNDMAGGHWGDAAHWDDNARALGYLVDDVPAIGAVAQTDDGRLGHVAWVSAVGEGTVTIEEYNHAAPGVYSTRTVPTSDFRYLHLDDVAPAPQRGLVRPGAAAADAAGRSWTFAVRSDGALVRRAPGAPARVLAGGGTWSRTASPTTLQADDGTAWVAAVRVDGSVWAAHTTLQGVWTPLRRVGSAASAPTSSPALSAEGPHGVRLLAVDADGALVQRRWTATGWSPATSVGKVGPWSTHTSMTSLLAPDGRTWVAGVTSAGALQLGRTPGRGDRWTFRPVTGGPWSRSSSPALTVAADGGLWLHATTTRGSLVRFGVSPSTGLLSAPRTLTGAWSPYSSPTTLTDSTGHTWLAAVTHDGRLEVAELGDRGWSPMREVGAADLLGSPTLAQQAGRSPRVAALTAGRAVARPLAAQPLPRTRHEPPGA